MLKIILASKSKVRKEILNKNNIKCLVEPANVDEHSIKDSLIKKGASPEIISKNLAELKANKVSQKKNGEIVLGADSLIDLNGKIIQHLVNEFQTTGIYMVTWIATGYPSGLYFIRMQSGSFYQTKK